ncbi:hypothetical protein CALVIDRAFT_565669 [Calocera viscosa TUFC12733]|uniref:Uncharacterized protein n=1 Tax=Calocera viscosa (strain TUFC12733) TaxID=1330018 RepID=A0A167K646_CALVF|nr:hypothetical protein CALVIDRAFT_565669 [Calocera viscosa TUFC12733]
MVNLLKLLFSKTARRGRPFACAASTFVLGSLMTPESSPVQEQSASFVLLPTPAPRTPERNRTRFQCYAPTCEAPNCPAHGKASPLSPTSTTDSTPGSLTTSSTSPDSLTSPGSPGSPGSLGPPLSTHPSGKSLVLPRTMLPGLAPVARPSEDMQHFVRPMSPEPFLSTATARQHGACEGARGGLPFTVDCSVRGLCLYQGGRLVDTVGTRERAVRGGRE